MTKGKRIQGSRNELVTEQQGIKTRNDCSFRIFFVPYNRTLWDRKTTDVLHQAIIVRLREKTRQWKRDRERGQRSLSFDLINLFKLAASFRQKNARSGGVRLNPSVVVDYDSGDGVWEGWGRCINSEKRNVTGQRRTIYSQLPWNFNGCDSRDHLMDNRFNFWITRGFGWKSIFSLLAKGKPGFFFKITSNY